MYWSVTLCNMWERSSVFWGTWIWGVDFNLFHLSKIEWLWYYAGIILHINSNIHFSLPFLRTYLALVFPYKLLFNDIYKLFDVNLNFYIFLYLKSIMFIVRIYQNLCCTVWNQKPFFLATFSKISILGDMWPLRTLWTVR